LPSIRRRPIWLLLISACIIVGMWLERYVLVVSSLYRNHIPTWWFKYYPTFWDWALLAGSIGLFLTLFFLCLRLLPMVSMSEVREIVDKASPK
jgi:molybdopterin-containing oxidoreductase family membrane subunit